MWIFILQVYFQKNNVVLGFFKKVLNVVSSVSTLKLCSSFPIIREKHYLFKHFWETKKKKININSYYFNQLSAFDLNNLISNIFKIYSNSKNKLFAYFWH